MAASMSNLLSRLPTGKGKYRPPGNVDEAQQTKTPHTKNRIFPVKENNLRGSQAENRSQLTWNPVVLTNISLLFFVIVFLACLVALGLIWHFSNANNGFSLFTSKKYLWTYGPVAILIVLISLWRQLDYHCKVLTPWDALWRRSAPASKSILLDYASAFQILAFGRAVRNSHFSVLLTIVGFGILKVITVASTGLLFATTVRTNPRSVDLLRTTKLDASQFNESTWFSVDDPSLVYTAYALLQKGLPYPEGIKSDSAYDTFAFPDATKFPNVTFDAEVQGFFPRYNCSPISISPRSEPPNFDYSADIGWNATVDSATCKDDVYNLFSTWRPETRFTPPRQLKPAVNFINCLNASTTDDNKVSRDTRFQHLLTLVDFRFTQELNSSTAINNLTYGDEVGTKSWNIEMKEMASVICYPSYTLQKVRVTYDMSSIPPVITIGKPVAGSETQFDNFFNRQLLTMFDGALTEAATLLGSAVDIEYTLEEPNTMFKMMAEAVSGDYESLLDEQVLVKAAELVFDHVTVQIAKSYLTQPDQSAYKGQAIFTEDRLQIRTFACAIMMAGFGVMIIIVVAVWFVRPIGVAPRRPESIASIADTTAHSEEFQETLQACAYLTEDEAGHLLQQGQYLSFFNSISGSCFLEIGHREKGQQIKSENLTANLEWWNPLISRRGFFVLSTVFPMLLIAILEVIQRLSDSGKGFVSVNNVSEAMIGVYTRFLPALIMLLVATLFNFLDFNAACLAPFNALRSRKSQGYATMDKPLLGQYPPLALWTAMRLHYWAAAVAAVAAFVGSVLTIVVSGLLSVENVPYQSSVSLKQLDGWNTTWRGSSLNDNGAAVMLSLIESTNLTYPESTYDGFAFPTLSLAESVSEAGNRQPGLIQVQVPALRGKLDCTTLATKHYNFTASRNTRFGYYDVSLSALAPLPSNCLLGGPYGNKTTVETYGFTQTSSDSNETYFAQFIDLHVGPFDDILGSDSGEIEPTQPDNPPGCPSLAFWFGFADADNMANSKGTVLVCDQQLEQVMTNVTLKYPQYTISPNHVPIPDETTAKLLPSGPNDETAFWWRLQSHMDDRFHLFDQSGNATGSNITLDTRIATFFQGVLGGKTPMPNSTLQDPEKTFTGIQDLYRRYMAQAISLNMRTNSTTPIRTRQAKEDFPSYTGTFSPTIGQARLFQHRSPKLALQIMLGVMLICGALAWLLGDFHKVVPWNPCTIAGVAVLVVGGRMCGPLRNSPEKSSQTLNQKPEDEGPEDEGPEDRWGLPSLSEYGHQNNSDFEMSSFLSTSVGPQGSTSEQQRSDVDLVSDREHAKSQPLSQSQDQPQDLSQEKSRFYSHTITTKDQWNGMRFRLGWWRGDSFMGRQGPPGMTSRSKKASMKKVTGKEDYREQGAGVDTSDEIESGQERARWRYGIDSVLPNGYEMEKRRVE